MILGLDLSTNVCGYAISEDNIIADAGFFDISKVNTYKEKANIIINGLSNKEFDNIIVEQTLSGFAYGGSSVQTILTLAMNKAVVCYILEEHFKKPIKFVNASTMRKKVFGISRIKGIKSKEFVKMQLEAKYPYVVNFYKLNKRNEPDKRNEDLRDACVCSLF